MTIILLLIQIYSHEPMQIKASAECSNIANVVYKLETKIVCVPSDVIFRGGFE